MERFCLLFCVVVSLLDTFGLAAETTEGNAGSVFVPPQTAHAVLRRLRRYNSVLEEMTHKDNLERECKEEQCSFEEAREVFENDEKTMEFWASYSDGDQCDPNPCQNEGTCEDGVSSYVCWCKPNFSGKNCEVEVAKQCSVNNGGCSHFCVMHSYRAVCRCAVGYSLGSDRKSCEPTVPFSCGRSLLSSSNTRSTFSPRSVNSTHAESGRNTSSDFEDDYYEDLSEIFTYLDPAEIELEPFNVSINSTNQADSVKPSDVEPTVDPNEGVTGSRKARSASQTPPEEQEEKFSWAFPQLPTITAEENTDQRVVGGHGAKPGEIPWQVGLMSHSPGTTLPFCGGSLLSESWVITAAHCLVQASVEKTRFFIRAGELDVNVPEGHERDHEVAQMYLHPSYDFKKSLYNHDLALLKLATPVELSNHRRPICLGPKDFTESLLRDSSGSMVSGWGRQQFLGRQAPRLQKLQVPYVDRTACKHSSQDHITHFMFCAGYHNSRNDSCQGDSGGPHATNYKGTWFLTGIISWGEKCAMEGKYGIYTRVSRYSAWIRRTLAGNN